MAAAIDTASIMSRMREEAAADARAEAEAKMRRPCKHFRDQVRASEIRNNHAHHAVALIVHERLV
eukprot:6587810-Prymnesium_polylepis.1